MTRRKVIGEKSKRTKEFDFKPINMTMMMAMQTAAETFIPIQYTCIYIKWMYKKGSVYKWIYLCPLRVIYGIYQLIIIIISTYFHARTPPYSITLHALFTAHNSNGRWLSVFFLIANINRRSQLETIFYTDFSSLIYSMHERRLSNVSLRLKWIDMDANETVSLSS